MEEEDDSWFAVEDPESGAIDKVVIPVRPVSVFETVNMGLDALGDVCMKLDTLEKFSGRVHFVVVPGSVKNDSDLRTEMALLRQKGRDLAESLEAQVHGKPLFIEVSYGIRAEGDDGPMPLPPAWLGIAVVSGVLSACLFAYSYYLYLHAGDNHAKAAGDVAPVLAGAFFFAGMVYIHVSNKDILHKRRLTGWSDFMYWE